MTLPEAVRQLRVAAGDTQQSFAHRLGLSMRAVANYEKDRNPNSVALYRLARLARELGREDLAEFFSEALSEGLSDEKNEVVKPMTPEEKAWSDAILALCRNRDLIKWGPIGRAVVRTLETLARKTVGKDTETLPAILFESRYWMNCVAERRLQSLTKRRQQDTGEDYAKAYSRVLEEKPELYLQYQQERAKAARGTPFEKSLTFPYLNKPTKSKAGK